MKNTRTDIHTPSQIIPSDYSEVAIWAMNINGITGTLATLSLHCADAAQTCKGNAPVNEHYSKLAAILLKANDEFKTECANFDATELEGKS